MAAFEWKDEYSVNIGAMDEQHKKLVGMINDLDIAIASGTNNEVLSETFNGLMDYISTHFKSEEELMKKYDYPNLYDHGQNHIDFTLKIANLKRSYDAYQHRESAEQVVLYLTKWLLGHIMGVDKRYGIYLNKLNVF